MFSVHQPKVYRSTQGCCICKTKSGSSRFTDSKKYETDFISCFKLSIPRKGEVCNACIAIVKRFKSLPPGSTHHWGYMVDARLGRGRKSLKLKKRKENQVLQQQNGNGMSASIPAQNLKSLSRVSGRFPKILKKKKKLIETETRDSSLSSVDDLDNENNRMTERTYKKHQRKAYRPLKNRRQINASAIDEQFWMQMKTCCGTVYENKFVGAVMVDSTCVSMCPLHKRFPAPTNEIIPNSNLHQHSPLDTFNSKVDAFNSQAQEMYANNAAQRCIVDSSISLLGCSSYEPFHKNEHVDTTSIKNNYKLSKLAQTSNEMSSKSYNYLHKIKADCGKIAKLPTKLKSSDLNIVKNLVKFCHEKSAKVAPLNDKLGVVANNEKLNEVLGTKMNENSSEDEMSKTQELNQKSRTGAIRPVIYANVPPQNLVLAGISPTHSKSLYKSSTMPAQNQIVAINQQDFMQNVISSTTSNKVEATPNNPTNLNQNLVVMKPKYFQQATN